MKVTLKHKTPCLECPWRRESLPGWLGGYEAEWFAERVRAAHPINCHMALDDGKSHTLSEGVILETYPLCAGALITQRNMCAVPRDPVMREAVASVERDTETVFFHPSEFINHHG